jgi:hypothetical protein
MKNRHHPILSCTKKLLPAISMSLKKISQIGDLFIFVSLPISPKSLSCAAFGAIVFLILYCFPNENLLLFIDRYPLRKGVQRVFPLGNLNESKNVLKKSVKKIMLITVFFLWKCLCGINLSFGEN